MRPSVQRLLREGIRLSFFCDPGKKETKQRPQEKTRWHRLSLSAVPGQPLGDLQGFWQESLVTRFRPRFPESHAFQTDKNQKNNRFVPTGEEYDAFVLANHEQGRRPAGRAPAWKCFPGISGQAKRPFRVCLLQKYTMDRQKLQSKMGSKGYSLLVWEMGASLVTLRRRKRSNSDCREALYFPLPPAPIPAVISRWKTVPTAAASETDSKTVEMLGATPAWTPLRCRFWDYCKAITNSPLSISSAS